jgi:hypothetical protein
MLLPPEGLCVVALFALAQNYDRSFKESLPPDATALATPASSQETGLAQRFTACVANSGNKTKNGLRRCRPRGFVAIYIRSLPLSGL